VKVGLGGIAWAFLGLFVLAVTALVFWSLLALVILGSRPIGLVLAILAVVLALAGAAYWLVTRHVTSRRMANRAVGLTVVVLLFAGGIWAAKSYDQALFLARVVAWGEADVHDYQKFPERAVANAAPVFDFDRRLAPELFRTIEYPVDGQLETTAFDDFLRETDTTSFIVIKDDAIVYEGYFNGYERDSIVTSFSIAKSVTSALVGIAIDEGFISSVDDPMVAYLPEMRGRGLDDVTIRDLLLMSTGIEFVHDDDLSGFEVVWPYQDESLVYYHPNLRDLALGLSASEEPLGAGFIYNQYHPLLLGMILERTTHRPVAQYLADTIWEPLGMEFPASWSIDSEADGFEKMESGLNGRAIDFAKFGRLYLDNGNWDGRRIISEQWVAESTGPDPGDDRPFLTAKDWQDDGGYYGYMWWGKTTADGGYYYSALGNLGQRISVFPSDDLIVARFGIDDGGADWDSVVESVAAKLR
jgi:CubicO group peptidase (beta-lactamase class C family)